MKARRILTAAALLAAPACNEIADIEPGTLDTSSTETTSDSTSSTGGSTGSTITSDTSCAAGETRACYSAPPVTLGVGVCKGGVNVCVDGQWDTVCQGEVVPVIEVCDGADNNCDGTVDEGCACAAGETQSCYSGPDGTMGAGICVAGQQLCQGGSWGPCQGDVVPQQESCANTGADDNCNGSLDDVPDLGTACDTGEKGICQVGALHCVSGVLQCEQSVQAGAEVCDGLDNNCNGMVDDIFGACGLQIPMGGLCDGSLKCQGGSAVCAPMVYFVDDFSSGAAWGLTGEWQIGPTAAGAAPQAGNPDPTQDHSVTADNKVAGVMLGGNASTSPHGPDYLTSPAIDINHTGTMFLSYYRYLNTNGSPDMLDTVEVSMDGGSAWITLWQSPPTPIYDSGWVLTSFDISAYKSPMFRVRFGVQVLSPSGPAVSSWNIDDVMIGSCPPP